MDALKLYYTEIDMSRLTDLAIKKLAMRKIAAAPKAPAKAEMAEMVPEEYVDQRFDAYVHNDSLPKDLKHLFGAITPFARGSVSGLEDRRIDQARNYAKRFNFGLPGSDAYNNAIKYLIDRGETNWYNFNNPKNPRKNPAIPEGIKGTDKEAMLDSIGNTMAYNQPESNTYYG